MALNWKVGKTSMDFGAGLARSGFNHSLIVRVLGAAAERSKAGCPGHKPRLFDYYSCLRQCSMRLRKTTIGQKIGYVEGKPMGTPHVAKQIFKLSVQYEY